MEELFFHMATQAQGAELALYSIKLVSQDTLVSARKLLWSSFFSVPYRTLGLGGWILKMLSGIAERHRSGVQQRQGESKKRDIQGQALERTLGVCVCICVCVGCIPF